MKLYTLDFCYKAQHLENEVVSANFVLSSQTSSPAELICCLGNQLASLLLEKYSRVRFHKRDFQLSFWFCMKVLLVREILGGLSLSFFQLEFFRWRAVFPVNFPSPCSNSALCECLATSFPVFWCGECLMRMTLAFSTARAAAKPVFQCEGRQPLPKTGSLGPHRRNCMWNRNLFFLM